MTTWTLGVFRPTAGQTSGTQADEGFEATYEQTGFTFDDTKIVKSWTPNSSNLAVYPASDKNITVQKLLNALSEGFGQAGGAIGSQWLYCMDNGAGTVLYANRDLTS